MEPTDGPLNNPPINTQTTAMLGITFCQDRFDDDQLPQSNGTSMGEIRRAAPTPKI